MAWGLEDIAKDAKKTVDKIAEDAKEEADVKKNNWTAKARTDLGIVMIWFQSKWFQIHCETPSMTHKQDMNERIACDDHIPYEVNYGGEEYSFDLKGCDQSKRWIFEHIMYRQSRGTLQHMPHIYVYKYNKKGERVLDYKWRNCVFEEIKQDTNEPFDVSGKCYEPILDAK